MYNYIFVLKKEWTIESRISALVMIMRTNFLSRIISERPGLVSITKELKLIGAQTQMKVHSFVEHRLYFCGTSN